MNNLVQSLLKLSALSLLVLNGSAIAGQWKPLCIEGSSCSAPYRLSEDGSGPFVTSEGILLLHDPLNYDGECWVIPRSDCFSNRDVFMLSPLGMENLGTGFGQVSDGSAIELPDGKKLNFSKWRVTIWPNPTGKFEYVNWSGQDAVNGSNDALIITPVSLGDAVYIGLQDSGGGSRIHKSDDAGITWTKKFKKQDVPEGSDRFNLLINPENNALWFINWQVWDDDVPSLWESTDEGENWSRVDDGSFPPDTLRVVHDSISPLTSFALSAHGLFVSNDRGVSWQATPLTDAVRSLIFLDRNEPQIRVMIIATDSGIMASEDEGVTWLDMSNGLLALPHAVTFAHEQLVASSEAGYFTCNSLDCFGRPQSLQLDVENDLVEVVEFYNTNLKHYFITGTDEEASLIDEGAAGPGWVRTGEAFLAWSHGSWEDAVNVCRFYGSLHPGPNSHFYSVTPSECRFLMDLEEIIPDGQPRWNFEGYAFSILPPSQVGQKPCPETTIPVYRAYNNGFAKGIDSNHRYVTNLELLTPLVEEGWSIEGVAFCSPDNREVRTK